MLDPHLLVVVGHHVLGNIPFLLPIVVHSLPEMEALLLTTIDLVRFEVLRRKFLLTGLVEDHLLFDVHFVSFHEVFLETGPFLVYVSKQVSEVPMVHLVVAFELVGVLFPVISQLVLFASMVLTLPPSVSTRSVRLSPSVFFSAVHCRLWCGFA